MHTSNHDPINWEDLSHDHMTQDFGVHFPLTWVIMKVIKQGLSFLMVIHQLQRRVRKV